MTVMCEEIDTLLSGADASFDDAPKGDTLLTSIINDALPTTLPIAELFSRYLVSPSYHVEIDTGLLIKLVTAKGEPFYLFDPKKQTRSLVCGITEVYVTPYDADTVCVDKCEGMPELHLVHSTIAAKLFTHALKDICTAKWFTGILFVSSVGLQTYYKSPEMEGEIYRVAADKEGHVDAREVAGALPCDYPVPYLLVDESILAEGTNSVAIIESLSQANAALIDSLCRLEYGALHAAEAFPDCLHSSLGNFMGTHSHLVRGLLDAQLQSAGTMNGKTPCDDAFVRRQRKGEIDTLVRLMMREVELVGNLKRVLEELQEVQNAVLQCPKAPKLGSCAAESAACGKDDDDSSSMGGSGDPVMRPLLKMSLQEGRSERVLGDIDKAEEMIGIPMADSEFYSSGSECSR